MQHPQVGRPDEQQRERVNEDEQPGRVLPAHGVRVVDVNRKAHPVGSVELRSKVVGGRKGSRRRRSCHSPEQCQPQDDPGFTAGPLVQWTGDRNQSIPSDQRQEQRGRLTAQGAEKTAEGTQPTRSPFLLVQQVLASVGDMGENRIQLFPIGVI